MSDSGLGDALRIGPLEVFPDRALARAGGHTLTLSVLELRLLAALAEQAGWIIPRAELYRRVWCRELRDGDRSLDVYVGKLRSKLQTALPGWRLIHTHVGVGYRLNAERYQEAHISVTTR